MHTLLYVVSIAFLVLGALVSAINAWICFRQLLGKHSPSIVPLIGGVSLLVGALIFPNGSLIPWAFIGILVDYGCLPYVVMLSISMALEFRRYSSKNIVFGLDYDAQECDGQILLFKRNECIFKYRYKNGKAYGSMIMKIDEYYPGWKISLSIQNISIVIGYIDGAWSLISESGWHDKKLSLQGSTITEKAANKTMHRSADAPGDL
jgi:hypothetical protein